MAIIQGVEVKLWVCLQFSKPEREKQHILYLKVCLLTSCMDHFYGTFWKWKPMIMIYYMKKSCMNILQSIFFGEQQMISGE